MPINFVMQGKCLFSDISRPGVKKVHSAIKLCSYYFSYNVCNDINVTETH